MPSASPLGVSAGARGMHRLVCRPVLLCFPLSNLPGPRAIYRWSPLCKNAAEMPVWSTVVPYSCIASEIHAGPGKAWWDGFGRAWACSYGCSRDETLTPCGIPSPISTGCTGGGISLAGNSVPCSRRDAGKAGHFPCSVSFAASRAVPFHPGLSSREARGVLGSGHFSAGDRSPEGDCVASRPSVLSPRLRVNLSPL